MTVTQYQKQPPRQDYTRLTLTAPAQWEEPLTMLLFDHGAEGVQASAERAIQAHLQAGDWDASVFDSHTLDVSRVTLTTLFAQADQAEQAAQAARLFGREQGMELEATLAPSPYTDWQQQWKDAFPPLPMGRKLWVTPYWRQDPVPKGRRPVLIDPGMAFGTGDHPTTAMALELIEEFITPGAGILDLGCGSGILSIAGLKLGAGWAQAVDIDPICGPSVARHRELNGASQQELPFICGDVLTDEKLQRQLRGRKAGLVVANITAAVLAELGPVVGRFMADKAMLICSGILDEYSADLADRLASCGFTMVNIRKRDGWAAFACAPAFE